MTMYEYKVDIYKVKYAEEAMNTYAQEGWRVIAVTPHHLAGFLDVFYEREVCEDDADTDDDEIEIIGEEDEDEIEVVIEDSDEAEFTELDKSRFAVPDDIWDFTGEEESEDNE